MAQLLLPRCCPKCGGSCYTSKLGVPTTNTSKWQCEDCNKVFVLVGKPPYTLHETNEKPFINFD